MSKFIELHRSGKDEAPILINVDYIAYIQNARNETIIYLGIGENDNTKQVIHVKETYEEVKAML